MTIRTPPGYIKTSKDSGFEEDTLGGWRIYYYDEYIGLRNVRKHIRENGGINIKYTECFSCAIEEANGYGALC